MRIQQNVVVRATREQVWHALATLEGSTQLLGGLVTVEDADPATPLTQDMQCRLVWHLGSAVVGSKVEFVTVVPGHEIEWVSVTGTTHRCRIILRQAEANGTRVEVRLRYAAPGPLGAVADVVALPRLYGAVQRGLTTLAKSSQG